MSGLEIRELEAFLAVADELHFGRAGKRLYVSQSRVSQLLQALERRVGARLVDRTSRRVRLSPLGQRLLDDLRPAYDALHSVLDDVRAEARGLGGRLLIGFQGTVSDSFMEAVTAFQAAHADCDVDLVELPLSDPFGAVRRGEVDLAVVLLPVEEDDLVLGPVFSKQPQTLAVAVAHELAARDNLSAEALAELPLIEVVGPAPEYWRRAQAPRETPGGLPVPDGPAVRTIQEGLALVAADRGAMLLCRSTADYYGRRDVAFVRVAGLEDSFLGLVWHRDHETARTRAFSEVLAAVQTAE
jgi:DNA-binding transcriptional LysR family regulator